MVQMKARTTRRVIQLTLQMLDTPSKALTRALKPFQLSRQLYADAVKENNRLLVSGSVSPWHRRIIGPPEES